MIKTLLDGLLGDTNTIFNEESSEGRAREGLTLGSLFSYNSCMMRFIQKHGLLDSDFIVPMVSVFLLLTIAEVI